MRCLDSRVWEIIVALWLLPLLSWLKIRAWTQCGKLLQQLRVGALGVSDSLLQVSSSPLWSVVWYFRSWMSNLHPYLGNVTQSTHMRIMCSVICGDKLLLCLRLNMWSLGYFDSRVWGATSHSQKLGVWALKADILNFSQCHSNSQLKCKFRCADIYRLF